MKANLTKLLSRAGASWDCMWGHYQSKRYKRLTAKRVRRMLVRLDAAPTTNADLLAYAEAHRPPQAWYDEDQSDLY